jgi:hypothetical protein
MASVRDQGPTCQVKNWFADALDPGTSPLVATPKPGLVDPIDRDISGLKLRFWSPPLRFAPLGGSGSVEFSEFEQQVIDAHAIRSMNRRGLPRPTIPEAELETVEGKFKLRKSVAGKCRQLLAKARAKLAADKANGVASAQAVKSFGLTSAYRSQPYDEALWRNYFRTKYYKDHASAGRTRSGFVVGSRRLSKRLDAVVEDYVEYIAGKKAPPGYSNHTRGIAVDFYTIEGGKEYLPDTGHGEEKLKQHNAEYEQTWLYKWLADPAHKSEFGIDRIETEAWHWEFHGSAQR